MIRSEHGAKKAEQFFCSSFRRLPTAELVKPESSVFPNIMEALGPGFRRDDA